MIDSSESGNREIKRELSLSDVPKILRQGWIAVVRNFTKVKLAYKQLHTAVVRREGGGEQCAILNSAIDECKQTTTTVQRRGNEEIRKCDDFVGEYGRGGKQSRRYEF